MNTLYSFRRCPYAMRARMALALSGAPVQIREVVLRDKPAALLQASPKGTVPVLVCAQGVVIDESLDVMRWAFQQPGFPQAAGPWEGEELESLVHRNDHTFKAALDRYKYSDRYPGEDIDPQAQRAIGLAILQDLDARVAAHGQLLGPTPGFADLALVPFVRQFANTDRRWFDAQALPALQGWLAAHLEGPLFTGIMAKHPQWAPGASEPLLPAIAWPF